MGTLTSGVGLVSGLNYQAIIDQLMTIDARPRDQLVARVRNLDQQRSGYTEIAARITSLLGRISLLNNPRTFRVSAATSSAPDVLTATARDTARTGTYAFQVRATASTHQVVSSGVAERAARLPAGTLTIESAQARVDAPTRLDELNGYAGVRRGSFALVDAAGREASVNIADAVTLNEVVERINRAGVGVQARVERNQLILRSTTTGPRALEIREVAGGQTAADLGFRAGETIDGDADGELRGAALTYLSTTTPLAGLHDGLGVRAERAGRDFTVTTRDGRRFDVDLSGIIKPETRLDRLNAGQGVALGRVRVTGRDGARAEIDLSRARTVQDVKTALEGAFGGGRISVTLNGARLVLRDSSSASGSLIVEDVEGGGAARDLGILGNETDGQIDGREVLRVTTIADVLAAVNFAEGNRDAVDGAPLVSAAIDPARRGLTFADRTTGDGALAFSIEGTPPSRALLDLGLSAGPVTGAEQTGRRLIGDVNTVLLRTLNGGQGLTPGVLRVEANGRDAIINLGAAQTVQELLDVFNAAAAESDLGIVARLDARGTRLELANTRDASEITVSDVEGETAARLGLRQTAREIRSADLQRQYVNENTRLADLNLGNGVGAGQLRFTDSAGRAATLRVTATGTTRVGDLLAQINDLSIDVTARINATGDGIELIDTAGGGGTLTVSDIDGAVGRNLNLTRTAIAGRIDGSYEQRFSTAGESLETLVARINRESGLAQAEIFSEGAGPTPHRLSLSARAAGLRGALLINGDDAGLSFLTLTEAADARVLLGGGGGGTASGGILLTSPTNTFRDVVGGIDLTVARASDQPVTVTVARDEQRLIAAMKGLVDDFNAAVGRIAELSDYDPETQEAGVLFGDGPAQTLEARLFRVFTRTERAGQLRRLRDTGVELEAGKRLRFNEDAFRAALERDPEALIRFFTDERQGVAGALKKELENLAVNSDSLIKRRTTTFERQREAFSTRVDQMNDQLERKRQRLLRQFQNMENALGQIQSQQTALAGLGAALPAGSSASPTVRR